MKKITPSLSGIELALLILGAVFLLFAWPFLSEALPPLKWELPSSADAREIASALSTPPAHLQDPFWQRLYHWQGLIGSIATFLGGAFVLGAAWWTISDQRSRELHAQRVRAEAFAWAFFCDAGLCAADLTLQNKLLSHAQAIGNKNASQAFQMIDFLNPPTFSASWEDFHMLPHNIAAKAYVVAQHQKGAKNGLMLGKQAIQSGIATLHEVAGDLAEATEKVMTELTLIRTTLALHYGWDEVSAPGGKPVEERSHGGPADFHAPI
ncbi:hypothetical protein M5E06_21160 [Azospirillum sp. A1-3]|uniref:hypothetical protein n=1 Tax=Azospirillum sp. A1-3 TaxID=185874 RepID=UPI002077196B|nr:hypothetical protein [Azospirillum sp. A1-3]MCM8736640.1 hypothetical protein [Azospirillum sp. A1-3]